MNLLFILKAFFITVGLLIIIIVLIDRLWVVGKPYTGEKTKYFDEGVFRVGETQESDKNFIDVLKWNFGENNRTPWNEPYTRDTIQLSPFDSSEISIRSTFINHATILVETKDYVILTDPIFTKRASPFSFVGPVRHHDPYVALSDLPKIDFVVISHAHYDHLSIESIRLIEKDSAPTYIVPLNNGQFIALAGVPNERIKELDLTEEFKNETAEIRIVLEEAKHWSARGFSDRTRYLWGAYVIETAGKRLYFAGDTGYGNHFKQTKEKYGQFDIALLPIGAYEPRWFMKDHHMNPDEALQAAHDLGDPAVIGIHFGTFKLTDEGRYDPEQQTKALVETTSYTNTFLVPTIANGLQLGIK